MKTLHLGSVVCTFTTTKNANWYCWVTMWLSKVWAILFCIMFIFIYTRNIKIQHIYVSHVQTVGISPAPSLLSFHTWCFVWPLQMKFCPTLVYQRWHIMPCCSIILGQQDLLCCNSTANYSQIPLLNSLLCEKCKI